MSELKTNYKDYAKRIELAERQVWSKLPHWKREIVNDCRKQDGIPTERIFKEYCEAIYSLADSSTKLDEKLPAVPMPKRKLTVEAEPEAAANPS